MPLWNQIKKMLKGFGSGKYQHFPQVSVGWKRKERDGEGRKEGGEGGRKGNFQFLNMEIFKLEAAKQISLSSHSPPSLHPPRLFLGLSHNLKASHSGLIPRGARIHLGGLRPCIVTTTPANHGLISIHLSVFFYLEVYINGIHNVYLFCLAFLTQHDDCEIHPCHCMYQQFIIIYC